MNHGHYGMYNKYTTLVVGHRKLAINKPLALRARVYQWQASSDLGLRLYIFCIHLLAMVYILHIHFTYVSGYLDHIFQLTCVY